VICPPLAFCAAVTLQRVGHRLLTWLAGAAALGAFAASVSTDIRHTSTYLVDHDHSQASRELVEALVASGYFAITGRGERAADLVRALEHGDTILGVEIPAGFARDLAAADGSAVVQLLLDGTNSNTALVARGYAERIVQGFGVRATGAVRRPAVELQERAWFNPSLASRNYNVPAVVGTIVLLVCLLLTALAVVREREIGTLEQLMVSPLRPAELIAGKTLPFALLGLMDLGLVTAAARLWFHVPFAGSWLLYLLASILYLFSGLGLGLLLSTLSSTQQEAFMPTFLVFMPTMLLSGFMFPVESMPRIFEILTWVNPLRHYLEIVRGIFLKGAGLRALWPQYLALLLLGGLVLGTATTRFQKRMS